MQIMSVCLLKKFAILNILTKQLPLYSVKKCKNQKRRTRAVFFLKE